MASRAADSAGAYLAREARGVGILSKLLDIKPGLTALIGGGGKTTLLRVLAQELSSDAKVIVATSTKMFAPVWCPVLRDARPEAVRGVLSESLVVCVGSFQESAGKMVAPSLPFCELTGLADYVLVEADGSRGLPLKAHAQHEPVIPKCANRVVCVVGADGVGRPIAETCHRPKLFAQLAGAQIGDAVTPQMVARVLNAEAHYDALFVNKVESDAGWGAAREIAQVVEGPVVAGSLWRNEFRCLR